MCVFLRRFVQYYFENFGFYFSFGIFVGLFLGNNICLLVTILSMNIIIIFVTSGLSVVYLSESFKSLFI